ncbi:MAG TPA: hypothetical protein VKU00_13995 [Chthonomonadaceae bacterium]|nr:hypothetical protein [Chthonomonadaceae bacterium]
MLSEQSSFRNIRLVKPDAPEYVAFMRRMADKRPVRGGPRAAGEYLGGIIERCVQHWLRGFVPLQEERILAWEQRQRSGRHGEMFRELDGVWQIDAESLCLFEIKMTYPENMENGVGLRQLDIAAETLFLSGKYHYILKRLVYVATEKVAVLEDVPELAPDDEYEELGVIWVPPDAVVAAAQALELELPENWQEPESREGHITLPEQEEWRQYAEAGVDSQEEEGGSDNPLAEALRRALQQNPEDAAP